MGLFALVSFAVYSVMVCFFWFILPLHSHACCNCHANVGHLWLHNTVRSGSLDCTSVDTVLLDWSKYVDQEQHLPLWTAVPAGTVSPLVTIDDVLRSFVSLFCDVDFTFGFIPTCFTSFSARTYGPVSSGTSIDHRHHHHRPSKS